MIAVIDYKAGNLTSVVKTLTYLGAETAVTQDPEMVRAASKLVLPGVGHFQATALLEELGITDAGSYSPYARQWGEARCFWVFVWGCSGCLRGRQRLRA